tara:strand:+ start:26764 stop:27636 length:873 start_codon:yes stop_codon:yes gene_type:complete
MRRKGIILAGGNGTRLFPITKAISKQLLPIYDKPMIYYPITTLMLCGVKEILIITTPSDQPSFKKLIGDGSDWGIKITYEVQESPAGLAQALIIAQKFLCHDPSILILGDNLFHGNDFPNLLLNAKNNSDGATIFAYQVSDPERYGVVEFNKKGKVLKIEEKPKYPKSRYAITGLYFFDNTVSDKAKKIQPSKRGELEITDLLNIYLKEEKLNVESFGRGMAWFDTGKFESLHEASAYVRTLENRQGFKLCCPEEIAWRKGLINDEQLKSLAIPLLKSGYGEYLLDLLAS